MVRITVDASGAEAPYEQLRRQIAGQVADGTLPSGEKLPTVRQLASDLGLAANTVAKAYRALEADGVIATHGRRGTFVRSAAPAPAVASTAAAAYVRATRTAGLSLPEATRLVEEAWSLR